MPRARPAATSLLDGDGDGVGADAADAEDERGLRAGAGVGRNSEVDLIGRTKPGASPEKQDHGGKLVDGDEGGRDCLIARRRLAGCERWRDGA